MKKVNVIYCGMCNPFVDYENIIKDLKKDEGIIISNNLEECDAQIIFNGCNKACLSEKYSKLGNFIDRTIEIKGETINNTYISEEKIVAFLIEILDTI